MAALWAKFCRIYGGEKWVKNHGVADDGTWAAGLAGLSNDDLARGIRKCGKWMPSLPEFRDMCLPSAADLGMPEKNAAYLMAVQNDWSAHPAVYAAASEVGLWDLANKAERDVKPRFFRAYDALIGAARAGQVIGYPVAAEALQVEAAPSAELTDEQQEEARKAREAFKRRVSKRRSSEA